MGSSSDKRTADRRGVGDWLVNVADDVVVPMTTLEVIDRLRAGGLSEQSLVWRLGLHDWTSIMDVPQLRLAAGSRSPPPAPSPTPSASGSADSQANVESHRLTPVPSVAAPLPRKSTQSTMPNSLAPITADADAEERARAPGAWGDLEELLSNERRADQRSSRRAVLWAALGSATLAAVFALWLLGAPAPHEPERSPAQAAQPSDAPVLAPVLAPTLQAIAAPSASEAKRSPVTPQSAAPRLTRRPMRVAPLEPTPAVSASPEPAPAPIAPISSDSP